MQRRSTKKMKRIPRNKPSHVTMTGRFSQKPANHGSHFSNPHRQKNPSNFCRNGFEPVAGFALKNLDFLLAVSRSYGMLGMPGHRFIAPRIRRVPLPSIGESVPMFQSATIQRFGRLMEFLCGLSGSWTLIRTLPSTRGSPALWPNGHRIYRQIG